MFKIVEFFNCIKFNNLINAFDILNKNNYFVNVECNGYYAIEYAVLNKNDELFNKLINIEHDYTNIVNMLVSYPMCNLQYIGYFKKMFIKYKTKIEENKDISIILKTICDKNTVTHMKFMFELGYNPKNINIFDNISVYDSIKYYKLINIIDLIELYFPYEINTKFDKILYLVRKKQFKKAKNMINRDIELIHMYKLNRQRNIDSFVLGNAVLYDTKFKLIPFLLTLKHTQKLICDALMITRDYTIYKYITNVYNDNV